MRALLVEDDRTIGEAVSQSLKEVSYVVDWVHDDESASHRLLCHEYKVVLLNFDLPKVAGINILHQIRARGNSVTVLLMTASEAINVRTSGLDNGADDCLIKPFDIDEMQARIRAVVRRRAALPGSAFSSGIISINPHTREAIVAGEPIRLTGREFSVLQALLVCPGTVLSRVDLENRTYPGDQRIESNAIAVVIHSLRGKLGSNAIVNVREMGWMIPKGN